MTAPASNSPAITVATVTATPIVASMTYTTEQLFNRKIMSALLTARARLDPGQAKLLETLNKNRKKSCIDGKAPATYKRKDCVPGRLGYGRYYGNLGSLEQIDSAIRGSLCSEFYTDIDIVNCHCVLIPQMAKAWLDMDMPALDNYNANRDQFMAEVMETYGISRDAAKVMVCTVLYNGKLEDNAPKVFRDMFAEVRSFTRALIASGQHDALYKHIKAQQKNTYGSFLSWVVQREESKCLDAMMAYLGSVGLQVDVLAYDGCMTRGTDNVTEEILLGCEQAIADATGYSVKLKVKPMTVMEDIQAEADAVTMSDKQAYDDMKAEWEQNHFYFKPTGTIVEIKNGHLCHYKLEHASEAFNMWRLPGLNAFGKPNSFLTKWREDPERRIVDTLVYKLPENCAANEFSLFSGYSYQRIEGAKEDAEAIAAFNNILRAVCSDNEAVYEYVLNTFAHMIQKPFDKTGVCTIFSSRTQGTGKDTIMGWMMKIMGNHIAHYTSDDIFWDKHDTRKEGAVMMYLEEAGMGNRAKENALKARITSDDLEVRPCGVPAYTVPNIARYFMTTNEVNPVKIDETDRRFMITNCSDRLRTEHAFWDKVHTNLSSNKDWLYTIGKMLEQRDIKSFQPRRMPVTAYKEALQEAAVDSEKAFLQQWDGADMGGADLYSEYKSFCMEQNLPYALNLKSFGTRIIPFVGSLCCKKRVTAGIIYFKNDQQKAATPKKEAKEEACNIILHVEADADAEAEAAAKKEETARFTKMKKQVSERLQQERAAYEAKMIAYNETRGVN